jgi:chromosome segregation ATPase
VAEAALERAEANLQEIDQDAARKLPAYENSSLFQYLYDRGFGTASYTKRGFTRRMDRALAKFIDFAKAKQGYDFLKRTPDQMRTIIAEDRTALDTVMDELERRRDKVADLLGLPARIKAADAIADQRKTLLDSQDKLRDETDATRTELDQLEDSRGTYYRQAIDSFRQLLDKSGHSDLAQRAHDTPEITDDQIVARLQGVELEKEELAETAAQRRQELQGYQEELAALGRVVQRFRAAQFDSPRSHFVGALDLQEEIQRARELGDIGQVWKRIRRAQRWGPVTSEPVSAAVPNPMSQVLTDAMGSAATGDRQDHARRAANRRTQRLGDHGSTT